MDSKTKSSNQPENKLNRHGVRGIITSFIGIFIGLLVLLISAGKTNWLNGWLFFTLILGYQMFYVGFFLKVNPDLLNKRSKMVPEGSKLFDKIFAVIYLPLYFSILIISGIDAGRFEWTIMPLWIIFVGVVIFVLSSTISFWAMYANSFFECTVLISEDKKQEVVSSGPYQFIRHPGYIAGIFSFLADPLILGSLWGLIPSILLIVAVVIRTALEDITLQRELPGYKEYTKVTRFRLIPHIW